MTKAEGRFEGFADAGGSFFKKLAKNQDKAWFTAHKAEYEEGWQAPLQALLAEIAQKIDAAYPDCELGEPRVMRIYRDVRFSKDKSPYKTHVGGSVPLKGAGGMGEVPSAFYFHVGADDLFAGAGLYMMDPARLARLRTAILDDAKGGEIAKIVRGLEKKGMRVTAAETLKKPPKGVPVDHPRLDLLLKKGLVAGVEDIPREALTSRALVDVCVKAAKSMAPMVRWLAFSV
ncbi:MAG TPA: DUF2461 domain-containing protein [Byssovorax sp.]|jgi:uncharacterized protein (TIGR02453 family)